MILLKRRIKINLRVLLNNKEFYLKKGITIMKDIMNAIEKYNEVSLELDTRGQELKEDGITRASKKLQTLFLELNPLLELYTIIP